MPDDKPSQGGADYTQWHEVKSGETLSKIAAALLRRCEPLSEDLRGQQGHPEGPEHDPGRPEAPDPLTDELEIRPNTRKEKRNANYVENDPGSTRSRSSARRPLACNSGKAPAEAAMKLAEKRWPERRAEAANLVPDDMKSALRRHGGRPGRRLAQGRLQDRPRRGAGDPAESQRGDRQGEGEEGRDGGGLGPLSATASRRCSTRSRAASDILSEVQEAPQAAWTRPSSRPPRTG